MLNLNNSLSPLLCQLFFGIQPCILPIDGLIQCHDLSHPWGRFRLFFFPWLFFWAAIYLVDISTCMSSTKIGWAIKRKSLPIRLFSLNFSLLTHPYLTLQSCVCFFFFCLPWLTLKQLVCCNYPASLVSIKFSCLLSPGYLDLVIYKSFSSISSWLCPFQFQSIYPSGRLIILKGSFWAVSSLSKS